MHDPIASVFAKRLKAARALRGLSQRALGGMVVGDKGKGSVRINRYEQEVNRADMDTAAALARQLDVPLAYLFSQSDEEAELLLLFAHLSPPQRQKAVSLLKSLGTDDDPLTDVRIESRG